MTGQISHIYRWDLDKTYLRSEFDTVRDLIRTALQSPEEKVSVPGAVELIRELQRERDSSHSLVTFVSGSPSQMRETLEKKFELDGIEPDIFLLKPTLKYILTGNFSAVRGQLGYKLDALLDLRSQTDIAPETMFGDDAEQDAFIYSLYADLMAERIDDRRLLAILGEAGVHRAARRSILLSLREARRVDTVQRIFIHLEEQSPPGRFWVFGPRVIPIEDYFQASLVLWDTGQLEPVGVLRVAADIIEAYGYGLDDLTKSVEHLMRRRHLDPRSVADIAGAVDRETVAEVERETDVETFTADFVDELLSRARSLAPRSWERPANWTGPPNYLDILRADRAMRESLSSGS